MRPSRIILYLLLANFFQVACHQDPKVVRDKYFANGQKYLNDKRYEEAAIEFRNALRTDTGHIPSYLGIAKAFQQMGDHQNAIGAYQQVVKLDGKNIEARFQLGQYLLQTGIGKPDLFRRAQEMAEGILEVEPSNVEALILLGNAHAGQNNVDQSIQAIQKALDLDPMNLKASLCFGAVLMKKKDFEAAEKTFKKALDQHPDSAQAHLASAAFFWATQSLPDAERQYRKAFDLAPGDSACLYSLAAFYLSTKKNVEAENVYKEAVARNTNAREPRWGLADFYLQQGRMQEGMDALGDLLRITPGDRTAQLRLAELYLNQKNDAKAEENIRSVLARSQNDAEARYLLGKLLLHRQENDKALAEFEAAIKINPSLLPPYLEKASVLLARGDLEGCQNTLMAVLERDKNNLPARGALARLFALKQKPEDALEMAREVLTTMPNNEGALVARADAFRIQGKLSESKEDFQKLTELSPSDALYWHRLGIVEAMQSDSASAFIHFRKAVELKPDFVSAINDIIYLHLQAKQFDAALAELDRLSKLSAPQDVIHSFRGEVYLAKGEDAAAELEFRKTIELNPQNYQAYIFLGQMHWQRNNVPQALKEVDQLIARNNKFAPAFFLKAYYLQMSKDTAGAIANYRKVLELSPENPIASNNLAWMLCELNTNLDEAVALAKTARKKLPDSPEFADTLGWIYYKQKNYVLAIDQLLFSVNNRQKPTAEHYYRLGISYYAKGDLILAKQILKKSLDLNPSYPGADEARRILKLPS